MPNIAAVLKEEIGRLARKEIRKETANLQKASSQYRRDIAALKRQVTELERKVALLEGPVLAAPPEPVEVEDDTSVRFTAKGLRSLRKRLGLSAADFALLADVTPQSIYNWEREKTRPRKPQILRLAALRGMGKKEARARVEQLSSGSS